VQAAQELLARPKIPKNKTSRKIILNYACPIRKGRSPLSSSHILTDDFKLQLLAENQLQPQNSNIKFQLTNYYEYEKTIYFEITINVK